MAKNRSYTGGKRSNSGVTLTKDQYFQLIRKIRNAAPRSEASEKRQKEYETTSSYHKERNITNE